MSWGECLWTPLGEVEVVGQRGRLSRWELAVPRQGRGLGSGGKAIDEFDRQ